MNSHNTARHIDSNRFFFLPICLWIQYLATLYNKMEFVTILQLLIYAEIPETDVRAKANISNIDFIRSIWFYILNKHLSN